MADPHGQKTAYDHNFVSFTDFKRQGSVITKTRLALHAIYSIEARNKIRNMIADFRPDVTHVRNIYHHLSPSILWELKASGVPVLYHMNDFKPLCPTYNMVSSSGDACERCKGGQFYNAVRERCYAGGTAASVVLAAGAYVHRWLSTYEKCVDVIMAPSHFVKQKLLENGWTRSRIEVLPHFQSLPLMKRPHPGADAPILYFGRLSREKGVTDLLQAMQSLRHIRLVIAGSGPERSELEALAQRLELNNVHFNGQLEGASLERLIADSQFTVFPSHAYETLGKSILESYAHGRAVVASDLGSRRELVEEGKTGLLYRVKDVGQLAAAITILQQRPELSREMGEAGRALVQERHSQSKHLQQLEELYDSLRHKNTATVKSDPLKPLRIAYIGGRGVTGKYSGIESYYQETGKRLVLTGYEVTAYCRTYFTPPATERDGIRIVRLPTIRSKHLETFIHTLLSTIHACSSNYDVVHYHCLGPSLFSIFPRLFGKKTVVTVQGLDWQREKWGWLASRLLKIGEWTSARFPNQTIVVSRVLQDRYQSRYAKHTLLVPNGTEVRERRRSTNLQHLGLSPDGYVLFLGRFSPEKNCHLLIEAFEKTQAPFKLVLAGGSSHTDDYAAKLRKHASDRVLFLDWLSGDALAEVLTNAALFVLPSDVEGLSLALLDAMGAGVCVLASNTPENIEAIADAGFTFRRGDVLDLERMLTLLLSDSRLRAEAASRAQVRARQNYLWDKVVGELSDIYKAMLNPEKEPAADVASRRAA
jgi:glycosyltransferase involved in cell wall biosynthesis